MSAPKQYANQIHDEIRAKMPKTFAQRATSKVAGIRLFCVECMGGNKTDAINCAVTPCFLYPHRGSAWVPSTRLRKRDQRREERSASSLESTIGPVLGSDSQAGGQGTG